MKTPWLACAAVIAAGFCLSGHSPAQQAVPAQSKELANGLVGKWYVMYQDTEGSHYGVFDIKHNKKTGYGGSYIIHKQGVRYEEDPWKNTEHRDYIVNGLAGELKWDGTTVRAHFGDGGAGFDLELRSEPGGKALAGTWQYDWGKWPKRKPKRLVAEGKEGLAFELFDQLPHPERWSRTPPTDDAEQKSWEETVKTWEKKVERTREALKKKAELLTKAWEETSDEKKKKILEFAERARKAREEIPDLAGKIKRLDRRTASELLAGAKDRLKDVLAINGELPEDRRLDTKSIEEALKSVERLDGAVGLADDAELLGEEAKNALGDLTKTMNVLLKSAQVNRSKSMEEKLGALNDVFSEFVPELAALPMVVLHDIQSWDGKMADTYLAGMGIVNKSIREGEVSGDDLERLDRMVNDVRQGPFNKDTLKKIARSTIEKIPILGSIVKLFQP